jgi:ribonuclease BN (tRNA processing enzyme)
MDRREFMQAGIATIAATGISGIEAYAKPFAPNANEEKGYAPVTCENAEASDADLRVRFLGTGAAGWKPGTTTERRNSSVLLDGKVLIDLTVSVRDMLPEGCHPEHIFYTHSHGDHYQPLEAMKLGVKKVYVSDTWIDRAKSDFRRLASENKLPAPQFFTLKVGVPITVEGLTFTPLPANHTTNYYEEQALIFLIEKGTTADHLGVRMLYATDTGGIMGKAARLSGIDSHKSDIPDRPITAFVMEATMGLGHQEDFRLFNHSTPEDVVRIARMLARKKRYTPPAGQPVYLTHISNPLHGSLQQDELNKILPIPLRAAADGLEVVFRAME